MVRSAASPAAGQVSIQRESMKKVVLYLAVALCVVVATVIILRAVSAPPARDSATSKAVVDVRDYGARGDGKTNDRAAITAAMKFAAAHARKVYVPAGTFTFTTLTVPDGVTVVGAGMTASWLKGHIDFGSNDVISAVEIGTSGNSAVYNLPGANDTTFTDCHFRGGGGLQAGSAGPVVALGFRDSCSRITFSGCEVECNLGLETTVDYDNCFNDISVYSEYATVPTGITFENCHIGVSNGVRVGSPRMGIECYTDGSAPGWQNVTLSNSTFEAADAHTVDFSDTAAHRSSNVVVEGCLIKGGGVKRLHWGYGIDLEEPEGAVISGNTIWRSWGSTLYITDRGDSGYTGPGAHITGNDFDLDHDNGITPTADTPITLHGVGNQFTGNTVTANDFGKAIELDACHDNVVTGNTIQIAGSRFVSQFGGSSGNVTTPNTVT
jgi:Pectate lyase superfamily protein